MEVSRLSVHICIGVLDSGLAMWRNGKSPVVCFRKRGELYGCAGTSISIFRRGPDAGEWPPGLPGGAAILPLSDRNDMNGPGHRGGHGASLLHRLRPGERGFAWLVSCELPILKPILLYFPEQYLHEPVIPGRLWLGTERATEPLISF